MMRRLFVSRECGSYAATAPHTASAVTASR